MGTADDRVGDDDVCLRTLADHNLCVIVDCKTPVRVHLDQRGHDCHRVVRCRHGCGIAVIDQIRLGIPTRIVAVPVVHERFLVFMHRIANDHGSHGHDCGQYEEHNQNHSQCRGNTAGYRSVRRIDGKFTRKHKEVHCQQLDDANQVRRQCAPAYREHTSNSRCDDQHEEQYQQCHANFRDIIRGITHGFKIYQPCLLQIGTDKIGKYTRTAFFNEFIDLIGGSARTELKIQLCCFFHLFKLRSHGCRDILKGPLFRFHLVSQLIPRHKKCHKQNHRCNPRKNRSNFFTLGGIRKECCKFSVVLHNNVSFVLQYFIRRSRVFQQDILYYLFPRSLCSLFP